MQAAIFAGGQVADQKITCSHVFDGKEAAVL